MNNIKYKTVSGPLSVMGWVSRILLVGWSILMILQMVLVYVLPDRIIVPSSMPGLALLSLIVETEAGRAVMFYYYLIYWIIGTIIFGTWALLTGSTKMLVVDDGEDDRRARERVDENRERVLRGIREHGERVRGEKN